MTGRRPDTLLPRLDELLQLRHRANLIAPGSRQRVAGQQRGQYATRFHGQGMEFEEVREYRQGDEIRNIDWRVTARTGEPHLKIFQEERQRDVLLCVDRSPGMHFGTRGTFKLVQAARVAALLGWSAHQHNDKVGGVVFGDPHGEFHYFRPRSDTRSLWQQLKGLSESPLPIHQTDNNLLSEVLAIIRRTTRTGALVFLIADFSLRHEHLFKRLAQLRRHHQVVLLPIDDPADRQIPPAGPLQIGSRDGRVVSLNGRYTPARDRYSREWLDLRNGLLHRMNGMGIPVLPVTTDEDACHSLARHMRRTARPAG